MRPGGNEIVIHRLVQLASCAGRGAPFDKSAPARWRGPSSPSPLVCKARDRRGIERNDLNLHSNSRVQWQVQSALAPSVGAARRCSSGG